ncbi:MAG: HNH endonuclease, partial [Actinomycetota bacterium]|nr:HNH endonuclease [Actinomycetota bacterium]
RAGNLTQIARRIDELPACFGLFREGRISEDMMSRIARKVPATRDVEIAGIAVRRTVAQLDRLLAHLPEVDKPDPGAAKAGKVELRENRDGTGTAIITLAADDWALFRDGLRRCRDAEYRDRHGLDDDTEVEGAAGAEVTFVDAIRRMSNHALDREDATLARTGHRGERNQIVIHRDLLPDGSLGPGRIHGSLVHLPDALDRYLCCDAEVRMTITSGGKLLGITPTERIVNRAQRRYLEHRDGGCAHPLCGSRGWVHQHHILYWEDGGETIPSNLISLCRRCHRALHLGEFTIEGNPEEPASLVFRDRYGRPIEPPVMGPPSLTGQSEPAPYIPPTGEPETSAWFTWN